MQPTIKQTRTQRGSLASLFLGSLGKFNGKVSCFIFIFNQNIIQVLLLKLIEMGQGGWLIGMVTFISTILWTAWHRACHGAADTVTGKRSHHPSYLYM